MLGPPTPLICKWRDEESCCPARGEVGPPLEPAAAAPARGDRNGDTLLEVLWSTASRGKEASTFARCRASCRSGVRSHVATHKYTARIAVEMVSLSVPLLPPLGTAAATAAARADPSVVATASAKVHERHRCTALHSKTIQVNQSHNAGLVIENGSHRSARGRGHANSDATDDAASEQLRRNVTQTMQRENKKHRPHSGTKA